MNECSDALAFCMRFSRDATIRTMEYTFYKSHTMQHSLIFLNTGVSTDQKNPHEVMMLSDTAHNLTIGNATALKRKVVRQTLISLLIQQR